MWERTWLHIMTMEMKRNKWSGKYLQQITHTFGLCLFVFELITTLICRNAGRVKWHNRAWCNLSLLWANVPQRDMPGVSHFAHSKDTPDTSLCRLETEQAVNAVSPFSLRLLNTVMACWWHMLLGLTLIFSPLRGYRFSVLCGWEHAVAHCRPELSSPLEVREKSSWWRRKHSTHSYQNWGLDSRLSIIAPILIHYFPTAKELLLEHLLQRLPITERINPHSSSWTHSPLRR